MQWWLITKEIFDQFFPFISKHELAPLEKDLRKDGRHSFFLDFKAKWQAFWIGLFGKDL